MDLYLFFSAMMKLLLSLIVLTIISPIILAMFTIFGILKAIIAVTLKLKHKSNFQGLLCGGDVLTVLRKNQMIINVLFIVSFDQNSNKKQTIYEVVKEKITNVIFASTDSHPRFKTAFRKCFGYYYRMRSDVRVKDCLREMKKVKCEDGDGELSVAQVLELATDYGSSPLPNGETVLWEVLVGTQPMKSSTLSKNCNGKKMYPLMFRIHHGIADGVSLLKFITCVMADPPNISVTPPKINENVSLFNTNGSFMNYFWYLMLMLYSLILFPVTVVEQLISKGQEENMTKGPRLTGQQFIAVIPETTTTGRYVEKIKNIKNKIPGATFTDVLLTAYSACLRDYLEQFTTFRPSYITSLVPLVPGSSQVQNLIPGDAINQTNHLENNMSFVMPQLPMFAKSKNSDSSPLLDRLQLIMQETEFTKIFKEYQTNVWMCKIIAELLPYQVINKLLDLQCTAVLTVMVGPKKLSLAEGSVFLEVLGVWFFHGERIGMGMCGITYDGRLNFSFCADQAMFPDNKSVHDVFKNIYHYFDLLEKEVAKLEPFKSM